VTAVATPPQVEPRRARPIVRLQDALVVGAGGRLGSALLAESLVAGRFRHVGAVARSVLTSSLRGLDLLPEAALRGGDARGAEVAFVVFERERHSNGRDDAFLQPDPDDLPALARALRAGGVRRVVVVVPHAPMLLPQALRHGFASHAEREVAGLGFDQLVFIRAAQFAADRSAVSWLRRFAAWWLSECGHDKLLAFSCKRRGFCPSCGARRMSQTAAHLVDHVIPRVPVRQWVLSLPIPLRVLLAAQPELVTPVLQVVQRVVARHLLAGARLEVDEGHGGAVTLIQRFGSAANLNIHLHCLVLDGVYRCGADGAPTFVEMSAPTDDELHVLLQTVIARLMKLLARRGVLIEDMGQTYLAEPDDDGEESRTLRPLQAAAITYRIAFGPRAGQKVLTLRGAMPRESAARQPLCADVDGFSLHAAVRVEASDRKRLEQLCRYITRPALSDERVKLNDAGQVELKLKTPWRDGTTHLVT
jgi:hypothetical protein